MRNISDIEKYLDNRTYDILSRTDKFCSNQIGNTKKIIEKLLSDEGISSNEVCFVAVGSIGRREALNASDLDIIPILKNKSSLDTFRGKDAIIRKTLSTKQKLHVSKGTDLTKCIDITSLSDPETIGGNNDNNSALTRRILILRSEERRVGKRV